DWGDGSTQDTGIVSKNSDGTFSVIGSHSYNTMVANFPITVFISGNKGASAIVKSTAILRDVATLSGGLLTVTGSSGTDTITITRQSDGKIHATVNGKDKKFSASSVIREAVYAFPGDDHVTLGASGV